MISHSNIMQNKDHLVAEKANVKTPTIHFSLIEKYLADVFQFLQ